MAKTGKNWRPTKWQRKFVWAASVGGIPQDQIAYHLGIDGKTLRKHCPAELDTAKNSMIAKAAMVLDKHLDKNDRTTAMFTMKALAGWRDQGPTEQQPLLNLEAIEAYIAFLERRLGVADGAAPAGNPGDADAPAAPARSTTH